MKQKTLILLSLLSLSACQQFAAWNQQDSDPAEVITETCQISTDNVLSCLASSKQLSADDLSLELNSLNDSLESGRDSTKLNRLICLTLHRNSSKEQLQKGESLLKGFLQKDECKQQDLAGLLLIIQGNISLHTNYLNSNWKLHLKNKALLKKEEDMTQAHDHEVRSYLLRIQELEKQVQKLKEIESMLDKKVSP